MYKKDHPFKALLSLEERKAEQEKVAEKYPDSIPIICEKYKKSKLKDLLKSK